MRPDRSHRYPRITIRAERRYLHAVVAEAWRGPRPVGLLVLHGDDDALSCQVSNLLLSATGRSALCSSIVGMTLNRDIQPESHRHCTCTADSPYPGWVCVRHDSKHDGTPESSAEPTTVTGQPRYDNRYDRPSRLGQVLAWVGIIAGVVFVVAVIFFSGFFLGRSSDGHYGWHRGYYGGRDCTYPMMGPGLLPHVNVPATDSLPHVPDARDNWFVALFAGARVGGALRLGPALVMAKVSSWVIRAWIWRCRAAGLMSR